MATIKQLPTAPRTKVFRAIISILKNDPVLSSVIRPPNFRAWSGGSHETVEFTYSSAPAIRITPTNGPDLWKFPSAQVGLLFLNVDLLIPGTDADDQLNLWWALEKAIYPSSFPAQAAIAAQLQAAGSYDGLVEFSQPAFDATPQERFFAATGQMKIKVLNSLTAG
jgi:hypothetical protein